MPALAVHAHITRRRQSVKGDTARALQCVGGADGAWIVRAPHERIENRILRNPDRNDAPERPGRQPNRVLKQVQDEGDGGGRRQLQEPVFREHGR